MDKPPLPLMRLATCCRAPLALATLFSKCLLKDSFGSSQKSSYLVGALLDHKCMFGDLDDCISRRQENLRSSAEHEHLGLANFTLDSVV
jgi:hypothetical protein